MGLGHFGFMIFEAKQADNKPALVAGHEFHSPQYSIRTGHPVLKRQLTIEEILKRRHYARPPAGSKASGCPFGVGLSKYQGKTIVLLKSLTEGRVVEIPQEGVFVLANSIAQELAKPGNCTPAIQAEASPP